MNTIFCRVAAAALMAWPGLPASAWGPDGHHTVAAIAEGLIAGSNAAARVEALLAGVGLRDAAVWADCAKGIDPKKGFAYTSAGRFPECKVFETPAGEAEMADFVRRNDTNCPRQPGDESCHRQYHYTDEAIQRSTYAQGKAGTRDFDIVAAVAAAAGVLAGRPAPAPFAIRDEREALLLLTHYVGDIHQPLHVGAIYLDAQGARVDPDAAGLDEATVTRGGNQIFTVNPATNRRSANLHQTWDDLPESLGPGHVGPKWLAQARRLHPTPGPWSAWPASWASDTLQRARQAYAGLRFGAEQGGEWSVTLACAYSDRMSAIKQQQLTAAGAHLAQLLRAIWP
jgi:hypothetical protein